VAQRPRILALNKPRGSGLENGQSYFVTQASPVVSTFDPWLKARHNLNESSPPEKPACILTAASTLPTKSTILVGCSPPDLTRAGYICPEDKQSVSMLAPQPARFHQSPRCWSGQSSCRPSRSRSCWRLLHTRCSPRPGSLTPCVAAPGSGTCSPAERVSRAFKIAFMCLYWNGKIVLSGKTSQFG
jgi:hypothetical protein